MNDRALPGLTSPRPSASNGSGFSFGTYGQNCRVPVELDGFRFGGFDREAALATATNLAATPAPRRGGGGSD